MNRYKYRIDPPAHSPEKVRERQDFAELYGRYRRATRFQFVRSLWRHPRRFAGLLLVIAIAFLVWRAFQPEAELRDAFRPDIPLKVQILPPGQPIAIGDFGLLAQDTARLALRFWSSRETAQPLPGQGGGWLIHLAQRQDSTAIRLIPPPGEATQRYRLWEYDLATESWLSVDWPTRPFAWQIPPGFSGLIAVAEVESEP